MEVIATASSKLGEKLEVYLDSRIDRAFFLPPGFEIVPRLLLLLDDSEGDGDKLAELIRIDPGLTADVLRIANSVHFSGKYRIETVREAILRVGFRETYRIVMKIVASSVFSMMQRDAFGQLDLFKHSFAAAIAAQVLARKAMADPEVAFTAALLHDIGKIAIAQVHTTEYMALLEEAALHNRGLSKTEERYFDVDHAAVGAQLLQRWNFPDRIIAAVAYHHTPFRAPRPSVQLSAITYLANVLAYRIGRGFGFPAYAASPDGAALQFLELRPDNFDQLEREVAEEFEREELRFR